MTPRRALATLAGCTVAMALYALLRLVQAARPEPDAAMVLFSAHAGYFWRCLISGYAGGLAALATTMIRDVPRAVEVASRLLLLAAALLVLQSVFVP